MATKSRGYSAEDIEILEDLSPILHRPGMYTDPANPNHALVEVIDNASDEGLAGFAKSITVVLYEDGSALVEDDGRGMQAPGDSWPDGLRNMRQRLESFGGNCRIESAPGAGTKIYFELPLKKIHKTIYGF